MTTLTQPQLDELNDALAIVLDRLGVIWLDDNDDLKDVVWDIAERYFPAA